jgi:hypothetical protein
MRTLDRWERRLRPYAIPHLTNGIVAIQAVVFIAALLKGVQLDNVVLQFGLVPGKVLAGEVWRILAFPFIPPAQQPIWAFFYFYLFYLMGNTLETRWGSVAFNLYLFVGLAATAAVGLVGAAVMPAGFPPVAPVQNGFLYATIFLAFAYLFPDFTLMLFFILPIKIKWLAYLQWAGYALLILGSEWPVAATVLASVLNFFLFFGPDIVQKMRAGKRRMQVAAQKVAFANRPAHKCTTCGITNLTNPDEEFRYCSKCKGTPAYCERHLREHEHV